MWWFYTEQKALVLERVFTRFWEKALVLAPQTLLWNFRTCGGVGGRNLPSQLTWPIAKYNRQLVASHKPWLDERTFKLAQNNEALLVFLPRWPVATDQWRSQEWARGDVPTLPLTTVGLGICRNSKSFGGDVRVGWDGSWVWTCYHRLNGSSSPVLTATCISYGSLCDFIFPQPTSRSHPSTDFDAKWLKRRGFTQGRAFCGKNCNFLKPLTLRLPKPPKFAHILGGT